MLAQFSRWLTISFRSIRGSLDSVTPSSSPDEVLDCIREQMVGMANGVTTGRSSALVMRLWRSHDVCSLWFLRGELMAVLTENQSEVRARESIEELDGLFSHLLPPALKPRSFQANAAKSVKRIGL